MIKVRTSVCTNAGRIAAAERARFGAGRMKERRRHNRPDDRRAHFQDYVRKECMALKEKITAGFKRCVGALCADRSRLVLVAAMVELKFITTL